MTFRLSAMVRCNALFDASYTYYSTTKYLLAATNVHYPDQYWIIVPVP
jgi:hypothetical protein